MDVGTSGLQDEPDTDSEEIENAPTSGDVEGDNIRIKPAKLGRKYKESKSSTKKATSSNHKKEEPIKEVNKQENGDETDFATVRREQKRRQQLQVEAFSNRDMVENDYPKHTRKPVLRKFLGLTKVENIHNGPHSKGVFHPDAKRKCVICHKAEDVDGETELVDCHGTVNGETKGPERIHVLNKSIRETYEENMAQWKNDKKKEQRAAPTLRLIPEGQHACRSKFHMSCIMKYNAGSFFFQYAARLECQGKFLCPLHCCNRCNVSHLKQSAYSSELIECAKCLRAFHTQCYPAGARDQYVTLSTATGDKIFEMIICPCHPEELPSTTPRKPINPASKSVDRLEMKHLKGCMYTDCKYFAASKDKTLAIKPAPPPLINCKTCVRAFHRECCEVETVDGTPIANNQCEFCACNDVVPEGHLVLALWKNQTFWLARTVSWYDFPSDKRSTEKNFERTGYTVVQWKMSDSDGKLMSIVPVNQVAPLIENYVNTATNSTVRKLWKDTFYEYDEKGITWGPYVSKTVYQTWKTSKHYGSTRPKLHDHHGVCGCKEKAEKGKCFDDSCEFVQEGAECVPECGKTCQNRKVSTGVVSKKIELRDTKIYGYGVFAKEKVFRGEFMAEYVGEIIDNIEKKRRLDVIAKARDFQANNYMMDLGNGLTVDACRYGNIARYINHSCEPNSRCSTTAIYSRRDKSALWYESRIFVEAMEDIPAGEEITFCYQMGNEETLPVCKCGKDSCLGYMTKTDKKIMNPKKNGVAKPKDQNGVKKKEAGEISKDTRQKKNRDASQPSTSSATPTKRFNSQGISTPSNPASTIKNEPSTSASPAPKQNGSSKKYPRRSCVNTPSSTSKHHIPSQSPSVTGRRRAISRTATASASVAIPTASTTLDRRTSIRGRNAPAPVQSSKSPIVQAVQEDDGISKKRRKVSKVEGY